MIVLHALPPNSPLANPNTALFPLLILAGLAATVLVSVGLLAFWRRQSRSYLLIVLALGTLICKAAAGGFTLIGVLPGDLHHVVEHGLDLMMAVLLIAAVYSARTAAPKMHGHNE